jgi:hypothetical protein
LSGKHVGRVGDEVHGWKLSSVELVHAQDVVGRLAIDGDSPVGHEYELVVLGDDVGLGRARVLNLDAAVGGEGVEGHGAVFIQTIGTMLPADTGSDTGRVGSVGIVTVENFLIEAGISAVCQ